MNATETHAIGQHANFWTHKRATGGSFSEAIGAFGVIVLAIIGLVGVSLRWLWLDAGCISFMGGVLAEAFLRDLNRFPPLPVKDPRLSEALGLYSVPVPGQGQDADGQLPGLEPASKC